MVKKIRLVDEEQEVNEPATDAAKDIAGGSFTQAEKEKLFEFAEAIDWKLWEMLKILKDQDK